MQLHREGVAEQICDPPTDELFDIERLALVELHFSGLLLEAQSTAECDGEAP